MTKEFFKNSEHPLLDAMLKIQELEKRVEKLEADCDIESLSRLLVTRVIDKLHRDSMLSKAKK